MTVSADPLAEWLASQGLTIREWQIQSAAARAKMQEAPKRDEAAS